MKGLPVAEGTDEVLVPGERSSAVEESRHADGIPVPPKIWSQLTSAAEELGVPVQLAEKS